MEMFTAKVHGGRVDVPDGPSLPEGARVIVLVPDDDEPGFRLNDAQRAELQEAIDQLRRGEGVDGWELLRELNS